MRFRLPLTAGMLLFVALSACGAPEAREEVRLVDPAGRSVTVRVELARTPEEQQRGLMGRESLPPDTGMLFVFPENQVLSFWMKDTLIPLDILFFDEAGRFVSGLTMTPCPQETRCPTYVSQGPARYALEVPEGFLRRTGAGADWVLYQDPWPLPEQ